MGKSIIDRINDCLVESEEYASEFLPLKDVLQPIQSDFQKALEQLREKAANSEDIEDKVFFMNRYTDLVKRIESIFDSRNKRLQNTLSILTKVPLSNPDTEDSEETSKGEGLKESEDRLSPEDAAALIKILSKAKHN